MQNFENANQDANPYRLMTGSLWFVNEREDGSDSPISLKEFKNSIEQDEPSAELTIGSLIPKNKNAKQQLTFECFQTECGETSSFRMILYEDGTVFGKIEFLLYDGVPVQYFKGDYKISESKIIIWGVWAEDFKFEKLHSVFIELKKIKNENEDEELEYDIDEAVEFIRSTISDELNEKLSDKDIVKLLDLEAEYIEMEYQKSEKSKPYLSFDLRTRDEDKLNDYVERNAVKYNINLEIEEVEEIMDAELDYMEDAGLTEEGISIYYN